MEPAKEMDNREGASELYACPVPVPVPARPRAGWPWPCAPLPILCWPSSRASGPGRSGPSLSQVNLSSPSKSSAVPFFPVPLARARFFP